MWLECTPERFSSTRETETWQLMPDIFYQCKISSSFPNRDFDNGNSWQMGHNSLCCMDRSHFKHQYRQYRGYTSLFKHEKAHWFLKINVLMTYGIIKAYDAFQPPGRQACMVLENNTSIASRQSSEASHLLSVRQYLQCIFIWHLIDFMHVQHNWCKQFFPDSHFVCYFSVSKENKSLILQDLILTSNSYTIKLHLCIALM